VYEPDRVVFTVRKLAAGSAAAVWDLEIRNANDRVVETFGGRGSPPDSVSWDWLADGGEAVQVGAYLYRFGWRDSAGERYWLPERQLEVTRRVMQRTLTFERQATPTLPRTARPILILDHDRGQRKPADSAADSTGSVGAGNAASTNGNDTDVDR
jgi:hypothetical protein